MGELLDASESASNQPVVGAVGPGADIRVLAGTHPVAVSAVLVDVQFRADFVTLESGVNQDAPE